MSKIERALHPTVHTQADDDRPKPGPTGPPPTGGGNQPDPALPKPQPGPPPVPPPTNPGTAKPDFRVASQHLRDAGAAQDRVLGELTAAARTVAPATQAAAAGLPGWRTAGRLTDLVTTWDHQVAALERKLGESATGLRLTADEYARTETNVTQSMGG
ncbi:hypothetical protein [Embleya sp. MST-111070]|uniref:hypothetical protein n=1 Tax=Embleya sp. MST-111070 TaxID=3398231 RepID=UPI003F739B56